MLSAIFKLALQRDYRLGPNPIRETSLPRAREHGEPVAYDLDTVLAMLKAVPEPSRTGDRGGCVRGPAPGRDRGAAVGSIRRRHPERDARDVAGN